MQDCLTSSVVPHTSTEYLLRQTVKVWRFLRPRVVKRTQRKKSDFQRASLPWDPISCGDGHSDNSHTPWGRVSPHVGNTTRYTRCVRLPFKHMNHLNCHCLVQNLQWSCPTLPHTASGPSLALHHRLGRFPEASMGVCSHLSVLLIFNITAVLVVGTDSPGVMGHSGVLLLQVM